MSDVQVDVRALSLTLRILRLGLGAIVPQLEDGSLPVDVEAEFAKALVEIGQDMQIHVELRQAGDAGGAP